MLDTTEQKSKFQQLYEKYDSLMMWIAMQKLNQNTHLAEEALQDAWLYVVNHFDKVGEVNSPSTKHYLCVIAQGFAIDKYRKENKVISFDIDELPVANVKDDDFDQYSSVELKIAIDTLDDESKNLLYLTYVFGYKSSEVAEIYSISPQLVRKKNQLAKQKLRKYFDER